MKYPRLTLLNFEGDVLVAHKRCNLFVITDEWKAVIAIILDNELRDFIEGRTTLTDSDNKEWNFISEPQNAKPSLETIEEFIGKPSQQIYND
jgi:hypothetical protein